MASAATDGELIVRDLEVLKICSDPVDKTSEETITEKVAADAAKETVCPLVAAMVAAGEKTAKEIPVVTMVATEKGAATTT